MSDTRERTLIVVGPGERLEELAAALGGLLARVPGPGARLVALEDLAQLLLMRTEAGRLLLDGDLVPGEDIGILRRFLEDRPGWTLHVLGEPDGPPSELLTLPGAELLPWEPDLGTLRALAHGAGSAPGSRGVLQPVPRARTQSRTTARGVPAPQPDPTPQAAAAGGPARGRAAARSARAPAAEPCDLTALLDDLIVARALADDGADYRFEPVGELGIATSPAAVTAVLEGALGLAEVCAGPDGQVDVGARPDGDSARVEVSFPPGALTDGDLPTLLEGGKVEGPAALVAAASEAAESARLAAELGGSLRLDIARGKLRLELLLPLA